MKRWADYGIWGVRYDDERTHIVKVRVREDLGEQFGEAEEWSRNQVVSAIEDGTSFVTVARTDEGRLRKGQRVHTVIVNETKYIRTDRNQTASDNLENLPEI